MRIAEAVLTLVLGAATALAAVALHQIWWGLLLGVAATVAALLALPRGWLSRLPFGVGWVGIVAYVVLPRSRGGFVVSADVPGYTLLALALVVATVSVATLPRPGRAVGAVPPRT